MPLNVSMPLNCGRFGEERHPVAMMQNVAAVRAPSLCLATSRQVGELQPRVE